MFSKAAQSSHITDCLARFAPFCHLEREEIEAVSRTFSLKRYSRDEPLVEQDREIVHVGFITDGSASLHVRRENGRELTFDTLGKGDFFGFLALFTAGVSTHSISCLEDCLCCVQDKIDFMAMIHRFAGIRNHFYRDALARMRHVFESENGIDSPETRFERVLRPAPIEKAVQFIDSHFSQPIDLNRVARQSGLSPFYFSRLFKSATGSSFKSYLNAKRIQAAKDLLDETGKNISETCFAVGYNDVSYFSRVFRKVEGIAPSDYRKRSHE